jgi:hypothetical protein
MVLLAVAGCAATYERMQPAPSIGQAIVVRFPGEELSGWSEMPLGVYRLPKSEVVVSGHQENRSAPSGLLGVVILDGVETQRGGHVVEANEAALRLRVDDELRADVAAAIGDPALSGRLSLDGPGRAVGVGLEVSPAIVLTVVDGGKVRPFVLLKVALKSAGGDLVWSNHYYASTGVDRPFDGPDGWLANDRAALKASISASLAEAVKVLLADVAHPYARDPARTVRVRTHVPFVTERFDLVGPVLVEDEHYLVIASKVGDASVIAGVSIIDKSISVATPTDASTRTAIDSADTRHARARAAKIARRDAKAAARRPAAASAPATAASAAAEGEAPAEGPDAADAAPTAAAAAPGAASTPPAATSSR